MTQFEAAIRIAVDVHRGQTDKNGIEYIKHVLKVSELCDTEDAKIAALLHDVLEDSEWTLQDLRTNGIEEKIVDAVNKLTHRNGESLEDYYKKLSKNDISVEVKFCDLRHNADHSRFVDPIEGIDNEMKYRKRANMLYSIIGHEKAINLIPYDVECFFVKDWSGYTVLDS